MKRFLVALLLCVICMPSIAYSQEKIYVPFFASEGSSKQLGISSAILFSDYVNDHGKFVAELSQRRDTTGDPESINEARESAELISANYFVMGKVVRLNRTLYIRISLHASSSGNELWTDSRYSYSKDDLVLIIKDMATRVAEEEERSRENDLYQVTSSDAKKVRKIKSNKRIGFITGAFVPLSEKKNEHLNPGVGGLLSFDARDFIFQGSAELYFGKDSLYDGYSYGDINNQYLNLMLHVLYPFGSRNNAAFVCMGSGLSYVKSELKYVSVPPGKGDREYNYRNGLWISGGGGYMLKRNTDATFSIYARGFMFMREFDNPMYGASLNFSIEFELNNKP